MINARMQLVGLVFPCIFGRYLQELVPHWSFGPVHGVPWSALQHCFVYTYVHMGHASRQSGTACAIYT